MKSEEGVEMFWNPRQLLDYWFKDMSRAMDSYLRSPGFLGWMKQGSKALEEAQALYARGLAELSDMATSAHAGWLAEAHARGRERTKATDTAQPDPEQQT